MPHDHGPIAYGITEDYSYNLALLPVPEEDRVFISVLSRYLDVVAAQGFCGVLGLDIVKATGDIVMLMEPEGWVFGDCCFDSVRAVLAQLSMRFPRTSTALMCGERIRVVWPSKVR